MADYRKIKVSIIIPVYNVEEYIINCLDSCVRQTYDNIEIIIVDDCGNDNSMLLVNEWVKVKEHDHFSNIKIIYSEKNKGLSAARNSGIKHSSGEFLYFLDSDDWITEDCIESLVSTLNIYPKSEIIFAGTIPPLKVKRNDDYTKLNSPSYSDNPEWIRRRLLKPSSIGIEVWNRLIKREFIIKNNLYFVEGIIYEDTVWNFDCSKYINSGAFCKKNTYHYTIRENGIVNETNKNTELKAIKIVKMLQTKVNHINDDCQLYHYIAIWNELYAYYIEYLESPHRITIRKLLKNVAKRISGPTKYAIILSSYMNKRTVNCKIINWYFSKYNKLGTCNPII